MTYQYSVINATYSGTNTGGMKIGFAVTEKMEVEKITKAINDLLLR
jgi:heme/copper-type cytochrome/quinol oxidase subunit 2